MSRNMKKRRDERHTLELPPFVARMEKEGRKELTAHTQHEYWQQMNAVEQIVIERKQNKQKHEDEEP